MIQSTPETTSRSRSSRKDQVIRSRFTASPASPTSTTAASKRRKAPRVPAKPGSVLAMDPSDPMILCQSDSVLQVTRVMAGKRCDAVLVVDTYKDQNLVGILTDKDVAYRCVAVGLDASATTIDTIMTPDPKYVRSDSPVDQAMEMMLSGHFRHLPVVDESSIVGLLDITKILNHILSKIQDSWGKARALREAFTQFQDSWQNFAHNPQVAQWFDEWSGKAIEPDLSTVIDYSIPIPRVSFRSSVRDAAKLMKDTRQTAVVVADGERDLAGIFTTKDICLRVIAPNESDPKSTSIVRVMTPHPDYVVDSCSIQDALQKMYKGRYLHLPVRSSEGGNKLVGMVDVLQLTYHTMESLMEQRQARIADSNAPDTGGRQRPGPMWSQFWDGQEFGLSESELSQSEVVISSPLLPSSPAVKGGGGVRRAGGLVTAFEAERDLSIARSPDCGSDSVSATENPAVPKLVYKFRDPFSGIVNRLAISSAFWSAAVDHVGDADELDGNKGLLELMQHVVRKCGWSLKGSEPQDAASYFTTHQLFPIVPAASDSFFEDSTLTLPTFVRMVYVDEEGDSVLVTTDADIVDSIRLAVKKRMKKVPLVIEVFTEDFDGVRRKYQSPGASAGGEQQHSTIIDFESDDGADDGRSSISTAFGYVAVAILVVPLALVLYNRFKQ